MASRRKPQQKQKTVLVTGAAGALAKRVISRLRNPLWEMGPTDRAKLLAAAETIRRVCRLAEDEIPPMPTADAGERARVEARLAAALAGEFDAAQIARVTGIVAAALQT